MKISDRAFIVLLVQYIIMVTALFLSSNLYQFIFAFSQVCFFAWLFDFIVIKRGIQDDK